MLQKTTSCLLQRMRCAPQVLNGRFCNKAAKVVVGLEALTIVLVDPVLDQGILTKCLLGLEGTIPQLENASRRGNFPSIS